MKNERKKFRFLLIFAVLFATFVSSGFVSAAAIYGLDEYATIQDTVNDAGGRNIIVDHSYTPQVDTYNVITGDDKLSDINFTIIPVEVKGESVKAQPDKLPIGTIYQGSVIEANFLIRNTKEIYSIGYPPWVIIRKTSENVEHPWGTSCDIYLSVDTSEIGDFSGEIEVDTDGGNVTVPISVSIRNSPPPPLAKLLVTHTPFDRYSTNDGDDFNEMTRVFSENYMDVDYLEYEVPSDLSDYDVILVAGDTLSCISDTEVNRLQDFIDRGGRVIVCADYFWGGTIAGANKIIENYGLKMKYEEISGEVIVRGDDIVPDNLTKRVDALRFWRPSPVYKTGSAGKIVVKNPSDSSEGFVARSSSVGEVIVFGGSLWWGYLAESTEYDNSILFGNMVTYGWVPTPTAIFDIGTGTYPSIMGTHKGEIKPSCNINVSKLYTYPCAGTGGHTESIKLYENGELIASGIWNGYQSDYHNITITPSVILQAGHTYNYTIVTGSYPQIIHAASKEVTGGTFTCTSFVDANGKTYTDWIPAIRLE